jgi:hypothetical protein
VRPLLAAVDDELEHKVASPPSSPEDDASRDESAGNIDSPLLDASPASELDLVPPSDADDPDNDLEHSADTNSPASSEATTASAPDVPAGEGDIARILDFDGSDGEIAEPPPQEPPVPVLPPAPVRHSTRSNAGVRGHPFWLLKPDAKALVDGKSNPGDKESAQHAVDNVDEHIDYGFKAVLKEPGSHRAAMDAADSPMWEEAEAAEMKSHDKNGTWELVPRPAHAPVMGNKWVYRIKYNADGSVLKYKARLVGKGYTQVQGQNYNETYAPVPPMRVMRFMFAHSARYNHELENVDVETAFLNGDIEEEVYMMQPEGHVDQAHPEFVCRLRKALYGTKQGARVWNQKLHGLLVATGCEQSKLEPCLYYMGQGADQLLVLVWVDDITLVGPKALRDKVLSQLRSELTLTGGGPPQWVL